MAISDVWVAFHKEQSTRTLVKQAMIVKPNQQGITVFFHLKHRAHVTIQLHKPRS
jgi:hypothetical protein